MTYESEFGDFPPDAFPPLPHGWIDTSWHNDCAPSAQNETLGLGVWIDYPDPNAREIPGGARFIVFTKPDDMETESETLLETDSWEDVLELAASVEQFDGADLDSLGDIYGAWIDAAPNLPEPRDYHELLRAPLLPLLSPVQKYWLTRFDAAYRARERN